MSDPMCAASNSHSPNKCKILLHFGLAAASVILFSFVTDKIEVKLFADGGPEFGLITVLMLVDRLLVRLIKEPFESPGFFFFGLRGGKIKNLISVGVKENERRLKMM